MTNISWIAALYSPLSYIPISISKHVKISVEMFSLASVKHSSPFFSGSVQVFTGPLTFDLHPVGYDFCTEDNPCVENSDCMNLTPWHKAVHHP